jgi:uncharacterized protein YbjT (DUF2867 family)
MIVLFGATGTIGGAVLRALTGHGAAVRAAVRSPERAAALAGPDVETVVADLADPVSLGPALQGADRVFVATPASEGQVGLETALVEAIAAEPTPPHLVKLAALGYDALPPEQAIALAANHARIVGRIGELGVPHTVLAPSGFMANLLASAGTIRDDGVLYGSSGDGGLSWVDPDDVGAVAAHVLTSPGHEGASYNVTGPEIVNHDGVADRLTTLLGRPVRYVDVPAEGYRESLTSVGLTPWLANALTELQQVYRAHLAEVVTDEVEKATGRPATTLADWLARNRDAFG